MTKGECVALLAIATRAYNQQVDPALADDWHAAMYDVSAEAATNAMRAHVREARYFPTIAEMLQRIAAAKPTALYLPQFVDDPVSPDDIRELVERVTRKLRGRE